MIKIIFAYFAALISIIIVACGGGREQVAKPTPVLLAPEINLDQPTTIVKFPTSGYFEGATKQVLKFQFKSTGFFEGATDYGHFGVMMHADFARIETATYHGVGWIAGRLGNTVWGTRNLPPGLTPNCMIETWAIGSVETPPFDFLLAPETVSPNLHDDVVYDVEITSESTPEGNLIGYSLTDPDGLVIVTVPIIDKNPVVDMKLESLAFFNAGSPGPYQVRITNVTSTWSIS